MLHASYDYYPAPPPSSSSSSSSPSLSPPPPPFPLLPLPFPSSPSLSPPFQDVLASLRYTYVSSGEELPGQREIAVTASDGIFSDSLTLLVDVVIVNDNPPILSFGGPDTALFVEGSTSPVPIGKLKL